MVVPDSIMQTLTPATFAISCSGGKWQKARHLFAIDRAICDAIDGTTPERIIIIEAPPRHGKSEFCSRWLPAWYLGDKPNNRVILASYSAKLATNFGRSARDHLTNHGHRFGYSIKVRDDSRAASGWNLAGYDGGMITAGVGGPITGFGANLAIIDDPIKNAQDALSDAIRETQVEWFKSTLWTRLEPESVLLVIQTRWHKDDLAGWILAHARDELGVPVKHLSFPALAIDENDPLGRKPGEALWPERWPVEALELKRKMNAGYWWEALYQQRPGVYGNSEWPDWYFEDHVWADEWPQRFEVGVIAVDPSKGKDTRKGDYSAIIFCGLAGGKLWFDCSIQRRPVEKIVVDGLRMQQANAATTIGIEANAFQSLLAPEFARKGQELGIVPAQIALFTNSIDKNIRISRLGPLFEQKMVRIRRNAGGELFVKQCKDWPYGDHDDGPDGAEMATRLLREEIAKGQAQDEGEERWQVW